jgi:anti-anti-sigma factor
MMVLGKSTRRAAQATGPSVSANAMSVDVRNADACTTVVVTGRVTVESSPHLRSVLRETIGAAPSAGIAIDFTASPYLDTSAIATLLEAATLASKLAVPLRLLGLRGDARVVAEATELDHIFLAMGHEVQFT